MKVLLVIIIILILLVVGIYCNTLFRGRSLIWGQILRELKMPENAQVAILGLNYAGLFIDVAKRLKAPGKVTGVNIGNENVTKQESERIDVYKRQRLCLGITHFQQHASIPMTVAKEIQRGIRCV